MRSTFRLLAGMTGLLFALASCSAGVPEAAPPTPLPTSSPTATPTPEATPVPTPQPELSAPESEYGGAIVYAIEADTANPWTPQSSTAATSGHMVMRAIYDPLMLPDRDGVVRPNLLRSMEPVDEATSWELRVRDGIRFHDGTPLDAEAVADNLRRHTTSTLTGRVLAPVAGIDVAGDVVTVSLDRPWPSFPVALTGQAGLVASPEWLASVDADPSMGAEPVGTGPFVFEAYEPGERFVAVRNDSYWRPDLPYLDRIEFLIVPNSRERVDMVIAGEVDIAHTDRGDDLRRARERVAVTGELSMVESVEFGETRYLLANLERPGPLLSPDVRRAMAQAIDLDVYRAARDGGLFPPANSPFPPGTIGHVEDSGYPGYDPDAARAAVDAYETANGPIRIELTTTEDEFNVISAELLAQMFAEVGVDLDVRLLAQESLIGTVLVGDYELVQWRLHSGFDPDQQYVWWHSSSVTPGLSLNFNRLADPVIDENLDALRSTTDPAVRSEAAEAITRRFGSEVYSLWLTWPTWAIVHRPELRRVTEGLTLPDGQPVLPFSVGIGGTHQLATMWLEQG